MIEGIFIIMNNNDLIAKFEKIFKKVTDSSQIHEAVLLAENADASFTFSSEYEGKSVDSLLLMASITKLFAAICIL